MVNRPPPKAGQSGKTDDSNGAVGNGASSRRVKTKSSRNVRQGLEWSLRSLHKIDTSAQHFLSNYYGDESDSDDDLEEDLSMMEDQTAFEIFKTNPNAVTSAINGEGKSDPVWDSLHAPLRTGIVDGRKVVFELRTNVTQKPAISRQERMQGSHVILNSKRSTWEVRLRFWLMRFKITTLSVVFLGAFVVMNVIFAGFFYATSDGCCDDPEMSFGETFAFAVQTSTTIGYGSFSPVGTIQNFLVLILSYLSTLINTLFAGLLFTRFVTPVINIQFSDVMTICNVNGVPCLSVRLGNADGYANPLTDINVRLTYSFQIPYIDHKGDQRFFRQTEELKLLSNRQHGLFEVWTLRHVLDEHSPLFGLNFSDHPGNKIYVFTLSIDAVQDLTKCSVNIQTEYAVEDILIGQTFQDIVSVDTDSKVSTSDYSKMSDTELYPVWYPAKAGTYGTDEKPNIKSFGAH